MSSNPEEITFFAQTDARGQNVPFGIKAKDRTRHVYVIGKTGMGKSTLLENMAIQDIKNGNGIAFIDPHGQTAETLLDYIPESRKDDVLYFAPFDTDNPVSFNVMEDVGADKRHLVVSGLMSVFKKIWVDAWSARMEYILSNTLLALLEYPDSTLLGVNRMLSDKVYRKKVIDNITDPSVKSFWVDEFLKYNERYMQEAGDAIKNKIGQFTSNPLIRNIVGQPKSSFDIRKIMDEKKILIMNLSKGLVGETNANLLGSMLTTRIYLAAMSRADMGQEQMRDAPNFYFFVDEFQSFANATFADILSEARKYKLNLTIAHQYIEQMEEEVRNAVFGNVGTMVSFRVGPFDAEILETVFTPKFLAPDIVNLGFAQIYLTLMIDGIGSQPFSATTLPPIQPASISCKDMVIDRSRQQFSHPRSEVEKNIFKWHGIEDSPAPLAQKTVVDKKTYVPKQNMALRSSDRETKPYQQKKDAPKRENDRNTDNAKSEGGTRNKQSPERPYSREEKEKPKSESVYRERRGIAEGEQKQSVPEFKKPEPTTPKKSKNLDELRAVLGSISATQTTPEKEISKKSTNQDITDHPPSKEVKHSDNKQKESSLKDALEAAVSTATQKESDKKSQTNQRTQNMGSTARTESTARKDNTLSVEEKSVVRTPDDVPPHSASEKKQTLSQSNAHVDDPLSPKKLERMLRVTGNDKTPLG